MWNDYLAYRASVCSRDTCSSENLADMELFSNRPPPILGSRFIHLMLFCWVFELKDLTPYNIFCKYPWVASSSNLEIFCRETIVETNICEAFVERFVIGLAERKIDEDMSDYIGCMSRLFSACPPLQIARAKWTHRYLPRKVFYACKRQLCFGLSSFHIQILTEGFSLLAYVLIVSRRQVPLCISIHEKGDAVS